MSGPGRTTRQANKGYKVVAADESPSLTVQLDAARTWNDTYFDQKVAPSDLVAVFDVNYDGLKSHFNRFLAFFVFFAFLCMAFLCMVPFVDELSSEEQEPGSSHSMKTDGIDGSWSGSWSLFWVGVGYIGFLLFLLARGIHRQKKNVYGLHVALTSQGIRKDSNHFPFADSFHTSTTVGLGHRHASVRLMLAHSLTHSYKIKLWSSDAVRRNFQGLCSPPLVWYLWKGYCPCGCGSRR